MVSLFFIHFCSRKTTIVSPDSFKKRPAYRRASPTWHSCHGTNTDNNKNPTGETKHPDNANKNATKQKAPTNQDYADKTDIPRPSRQTGLV